MVRNFFLKHYLNQHAGVEGGEDRPSVGNLHFIFQLEPCFECNSRRSSGDYCFSYNGNQVQNVSWPTKVIKSSR